MTSELSEAEGYSRLELVSVDPSLIILAKIQRVSRQIALKSKLQPKKRVAKKEVKMAPKKQPGTRKANKLEKLRSTIGAGLIVQHKFKKADELPDDEFEDISAIKA